MSKAHSLVAHFDKARDHRRARPALGSKRGGAWHWSSYAELAEMVDRTRSGLAARGVGVGDRVALVADNRLEWVAVAYACYGLGAALVPLSAAQRYQERGAILDHAAPALVICEREAGYREVEGRARVCMDLDHDHADSFAALLERGAARDVAPRMPDRDEPASILYTSGTAGEPKGVVLSHGNLHANTESVLASLPLSSSDRTLSFLPWAHAFGHTAELHAILRAGASMAINDSPSRVLSNLYDVSPTIVVTVPLVLHRIYDLVHEELSRKPAVLRALFDKGVALKHAARERALGLGERLQLEAAERVLFAPLRMRLGGKLRFIVSGGAPLSREVAGLLVDIGVPIYQGYGLTEATAVVSVNGPRGQRLGSVGRPLVGVSVVIEPIAGAPAEREPADAAVGQVVVYGDSVMSGYLGDEQLTGSSVGEDGGLRTGDVGALDDDGYLHLHGRMDERYKLASGHDVVPGPIEEQLKLSAYIVNVMVYGQGRDHNVALVVVDVDALSRWASERKLSFVDTAAMLASERVRMHVLAEVGERSRKLAAYERIRAVTLIDRDFSVGEGLATPSGKTRREAVFERYRDRIEALF